MPSDVLSKVVGMGSSMQDLELPNTIMLLSSSVMGVNLCSGVVVLWDPLPSFLVTQRTLSGFLHSHHDFA